jgi:DNA-binding CsgD family transcriptional regulator
VQTKRKRWAEVHGAILTSRDSAERCVAVTIHPVGQSDVSQFLIEAYALTERERDVTSCLARGFSTKQVAVSLDLSRHTVRDHVKTIFGKVGARSRGELMARIFWDCAYKSV